MTVTATATLTVVLSPGGSLRPARRCTRRAHRRQRAAVLRQHASVHGGVSGVLSAHRPHPRLTEPEPLRVLPPVHGWYGRGACERSLACCGLPATVAECALLSLHAVVVVIVSGCLYCSVGLTVFPCVIRSSVTYPFNCCTAYSFNCCTALLLLERRRHIVHCCHPILHRVKVRSGQHQGLHERRVRMRSRSPALPPHSTAPAPTPTAPTPPSPPSPHASPCACYVCRNCGNSSVVMSMQWSLPSPDDRVEWSMWSSASDNATDVCVALVSRTHPLTYSLTHSLTHSLTLSLTHPLTHSLAHSPTHSLTHSHPFSASRLLYRECVGRYRCLVPGVSQRLPALHPCVGRVSPIRGRLFHLRRQAVGLHQPRSTVWHTGASGISAASAACSPCCSRVSCVPCCASSGCRVSAVCGLAQCSVVGLVSRVP